VHRSTIRNGSIIQNGPWCVEHRATLDAPGVGERSGRVFYAVDVHPVVEIRQPNQTTLFLSIRGPLVIGRECDGLLLADPQVSRRHLSLDVVDGWVVVTDLGSTNGSTLDGRPLRVPATLRPGAVVRCGETTVRLEGRADQTVRAPDAVGEAASTVADDPLRTLTIPERSANEAQPSPHPDPAFAERGFGHRTSIDIVAAQAQTDGVDVRSLPVDQGTMTIVFSDIEASTERNVELGDQAWFDVLTVHNRIVSERAVEFGGTVIKNQGDGYMLSFPGARRALDCMVKVQRELSAHSSAHPERAVRIRIGLHTGEVLADADGDLFGQHVVVAARLANLADGGEILVSSLTKEIVVSRGDIEFDPPRQVHLKGIGDAVVYPLDWARF
jgi:class 3 adenylate cyclase